MKRSVFRIMLLAACVCAFVGTVLVLMPDGAHGGRGGSAKNAQVQEGSTTGKDKVTRRARRKTRDASADSSEPVSTSGGEAAVEDPPAGEESESEEDSEQKLVDAFDNLTDTWRQPAGAKVTMEEIRRFREHFDRIPKARKDECIHRALNLVPDENVMLLAGILMDKTQDREILETVYNDVLNRDEDVKKPILREIFKDREHPCWTDTAWILDATGELPAKTRGADR